MALIPGYYAFTSLKRNIDQKVDWKSIIYARKTFQPGITTDFERKRRLAQIWNWGSIDSVSRVTPDAEPGAPTGVAGITVAVHVDSATPQESLDDINTANAAAALF